MYIPEITECDYGSADFTEYDTEGNKIKDFLQRRRMTKRRSYF